MENWVDTLIKEYTLGKKELEELRSKLDMENPVDYEDYKTITGMISDMEYSLDWMKRGRRPGNLRGIDRRSAYQRRVLLDMDLFPSIDLKPKQKYLTEEQKKQLIDILVELSNRERQCFIMHMAHGMTFAEISEELNLGRSTIQKYIERAKKKINNKILCRASAV